MNNDIAIKVDSLTKIYHQFGASTSAKAISHCLLDIIDTDPFNQAECSWGIYNFQSDPSVTWYEFAQDIFQQTYQLIIFKKEMLLKPIISTEFLTPVKRPANSKLDGKKLHQNFSLISANWNSDLEEMLKNLFKS